MTVLKFFLQVKFLRFFIFFPAFKNVVESSVTSLKNYMTQCAEIIVGLVTNSSNIHVYKRFLYCSHVFLFLTFLLFLS